MYSFSVNVSNVGDTLSRVFWTVGRSTFAQPHPSTDDQINGLVGSQVWRWSDHCNFYPIGWISAVSWFSRWTVSCTQAKQPISDLLCIGRCVSLCDMLVEPRPLADSRRSTDVGWRSKENCSEKMGGAYHVKIRPITMSPRLPAGIVSSINAALPSNFNGFSPWA